MEGTLNWSQDGTFTRPASEKEGGRCGGIVQQILRKDVVLQPRVGAAVERAPPQPL